MSNYGKLGHTCYRLVYLANLQFGGGRSFGRGGPANNTGHILLQDNNRVVLLCINDITGLMILESRDITRRKAAAAFEKVTVF